ncbi:MAG: hypothetical protein WBV42_14700 [Haladaptatus sp.]
MSNDSPPQSESLYRKWGKTPMEINRCGGFLSEMADIDERNV